jgi:putative Ca2+/H+ antiporter (TMEM165/GDT1 family)
LADVSLGSFAVIAATLFITELTDKDSLLLIAVSTRVRARVAFLAGATAFITTTTIIVILGSFLVQLVPVGWIRLAGGLIMIAYGIWQARGLVGTGAVESQESSIARAGSAWKVFAALAFALAVLDLAGDATEVLTIVLVARYGDPPFVFSSVCVGLLSATAVETALGNRLGKLLTPRRLRISSAAVFLTLGVLIVLLGSA